MKNDQHTNPKNKKNGTQHKPSHGPVKNLEDYLLPDWWQRIFNSMYLKTDADVVDDGEITHFEVDMFSDILSLDNDSTILDLACGQGRHVLELARRGFKNLYGMDRSHYLIRKAKQTSTADKLQVNFKEGDARKLPYPSDTFDVVMILGNSFGYFESIDDDVKILKEIFRVLKPYGRFLIDVADGNYLKKHYNPRSWEWIDKNHFVCRERSLAKDGERLISREVINNINKGVLVDQFYAERLYTKEKLQEILSKAGFSKIGFHDNYKTGSKRNQDMGLMERRIITTSEVIKEWSPPKQKVEVKNVAVIMGDPKKQRKKFDTPRFRWRKDILQEELKLLGQYGLRNKHELWRLKTTLSKNRGIARSLISKTSEEREKMENELLARLKKQGILQETAVLDDVLDLTIEDILERRLQTIVFRKGLARTVFQARQLITHGHITIDNRRVTIPGLFLKRKKLKSSTPLRVRLQRMPMLYALG